jgi:hypothetical protein
MRISMTALLALPAYLSSLLPSLSSCLPCLIISCIMRISGENRNDRTTHTRKDGSVVVPPPSPHFPLPPHPIPPHIFEGADRQTSYDLIDVRDDVPLTEEEDCLINSHPPSRISTSLCTLAEDPCVWP